MTPLDSAGPMLIRGRFKRYRTVSTLLAAGIIIASDLLLNFGWTRYLYPLIFLTVCSQIAIITWSAVCLGRIVVMTYFPETIVQVVVANYFDLIRAAFVIALGCTGRLFARHSLAARAGVLVLHYGVRLKVPLVLFGCVIGLVPIFFRVASWPTFVAISWLSVAAALHIPVHAPIPAKSWSSRLGDGGLAILVTLVSLGGVEIATRLLAPPPIQVEGKGWRPHPEALVTTIENAVRHVKSGELDFTYRFNDLGIRDKQIREKEPDSYRIIALGDSITMGHGVEDDEPYPIILRSKLPPRINGKRLEVINAATSGTGPWQQFIYFSEKRQRLNPDLVILQVFPENDLRDSLVRYCLTLEAYDPSFQNLMNTWRASRDAPWIATLREHSRAFDILYVSTRRTRQQLYRTLRPQFRSDGGCLPTEPPANRLPWLEVFLKQTYKELELGWNLVEESMLDFSRLCTEHNIDFLIIYVPSSINVYFEDFTERIYGAGTDPAMYDFSQQRRRLAEICKLHELDFIDLTGAVERAAANSGERLYFITDGHPNVQGHQVIAEALASELERRLKRLIDR